MPVPTAIGEIARRLQAPLHRVEYVIRSRGILPIARAGNARLFTEENVSQIRSELERIDADRQTEPCTPTCDEQAAG